MAAWNARIFMCPLLMEWNVYTIIISFKDIADSLMERETVSSVCRSNFSLIALILQILLSVLLVLVYSTNVFVAYPPRYLMEIYASSLNRLVFALMESIDVSNV